VTRPTPRRLWKYLCGPLRLTGYFRGPGDGRGRPQIPAAVLVWALVLGQVLRECSFHGVEALVRSPARRALQLSRGFGDDALAYFTERLDPGPTRTALAGTPPAAPYGVLLHATARADKEWPEANWRMLAAVLGADVDLVVPFGTEAERERASRIAAATPRARVLDHAPLDAVARLIAGAAFVVGVDTGLLHLAAALGVPLIAIFSASEPGLTGPMGAGAIHVLGAKGSAPSVGEVAEAVGRLGEPH